MPGPAPGPAAARGRPSSSLIPAVNELGSLPGILGGSDEIMRDAKITQIYEGTHQVQRVVMAPTAGLILRWASL